MCRMTPSPHDSFHRRQFLTQAAGGSGLLALAHLSSLIAGEKPRQNPSGNGEKRIGVKGNGEKRAGKAKSVICLFQHGGPSHIDLFDPKPALAKWAGKPYPHGELEIHFDKQRGNVLPSPFKFSPQGASGIELSQLLPHTAKIIDRLTLVRSMTTESVDHEFALRIMHTGRFQAGSPTLGAWCVYALGAESQNLPAYMVLSDPGGLPVDGARNWSSGWLSSSYQGVALRTADPSPVVNLHTPADMTPPAREQQLRLLAEWNRRHQRQHPENEELAARISNFELAARMQTSVPEVLDLSGETQATQDMYGLNNIVTKEYAKRCLLARRLVERGVRFVQLFMSGQPWDTHENNSVELESLCAMTDQPAAALVQDLQQRGMLDSTIVIWAGEFGRLPISQGKDGRDHNPHGFSLWLAGGGFKPGYVHGATDEFGYRAVDRPVTTHDLHATLMHALGLAHQRVAAPHEGRLTTLTDAEVTKARVISELLA